MPKQWYNLRADMKELPDPMINPATMKPAKTEDLYPVFCEELAKQEMDTTNRYIDIPEEIQEMYKIYRPSPLIRAYNLEKALDTPAKIYYKFEGNNTSGSHKLNSAIAQAYYAKKQGMKGLTTETGAGQWGTALSEACSYFGIPLTVYMVKVSYEQKPFRKAVMQTFDAGVIASPSNTTNVGRQILAEDPNCSGSLGCAISEAVEKAVSTEGYRYVLGSVLNQVLLHQSIIGLESKLAMEKLDEYPDVVIGCAGGGSNLGGLIAPLCRISCWGKPIPHRGRGTSLLPFSPEAGTLTISATPARSPPWRKCTPWVPALCPPQTMPAACGTTACPPSFPSCITTAIWRRCPWSKPKYLRPRWSFLRRKPSFPPGIRSRHPHGHRRGSEV